MPLRPYARFHACMLSFVGPRGRRRWCVKCGAPRGARCNNRVGDECSGDGLHPVLLCAAAAPPLAGVAHMMSQRTPHTVLSELLQYPRARSGVRGGRAGPVPTPPASLAGGGGVPGGRSPFPPLQCPAGHPGCGGASGGMSVRSWRAPVWRARGRLACRALWGMCLTWFWWLL